VTIIRGKLDRYRVQLTDREVLRAVGTCAGTHVLDVGCGEGYMSRLLASRGAVVTGIDACEQLVRAATAASGSMRPKRITFATGKMTELRLSSGTYDTVLANHSIQELRNPGCAFREFSRILRPGGRLVILTLHPAFYIPRSERGNDGVISTKPLEYFKVRKITQKFNVAGLTSPKPTVLWLRPLGSYVDLLRSAGFSIRLLREPHPSKRMLAKDNWWRTHYRTPMFLLIVAEKESRS
jgi:ubiquinone/menaquinone biosynthesis C-methylase UbiE